MRCFFHLEDGDSIIPDADGMEIADVSEARTQAVLAVSEALAEETNALWWQGWRMRAVDEDGRLLFLFLLSDVLNNGSAQSLPAPSITRSVSQ